jgi:hypothetical protein
VAGPEGRRSARDRALNVWAKHQTCFGTFSLRWNCFVVLVLIFYKYNNLLICAKVKGQ